jgi:hypothetical protein
MTDPQYRPLPRDQRPVATVVAVGAFAVLCLLGLIFGLRGLFAPVGESGGPQQRAAATAKRPVPRTSPGGDGSSKAAPPPAEGTAFSSPSGNIRCLVGPAQARCDISDRAWQPPTKPSSCTQTWGQGLRLTATSAQPVCADDALGGGARLAYGQSVSSGQFRCSSGQDGVTCRHGPSGRGFTISRSAYTLR